MTQPRVSSTSQPGYAYNPGGNVTNRDWREAALYHLQYKWATGSPEVREEMLRKYGSGLNPSDGVITDPRTGVTMAYTQPETNLILSAYLYSYSGGDEYLDSVLPYVPPRPDEYIESPDAMALRLDQERWEKNYGLNVRQEDRLANGQKLDDKYRYAALASAEKIAEGDNNARIAAAQIGAQAQVQSASIAAEATKYAADKRFTADIYGTQEDAKARMFGTTANLGLGLQGLRDERVNNIIRNYANPIDMVAREASIRALQPPNGTQVAAYQDIPELSELLKRGMNFQPGNPEGYTPPPGSSPPPANTGGGAGFNFSDFFKGMFR